MGDSVSISACGKHAGMFFNVILKVKPIISLFGKAFLKSNTVFNIKPCLLMYINVCVHLNDMYKTKCGHDCVCIYNYLE